MIYFSDFDGPGAVVCAVQSTADTDDSLYVHDVVLMDATGQSNGTGYATEESRYGFALTYNGNAQITSEKFVFDGVGDSIVVTYNALHSPNSSMTWEVYGFNPSSHAGGNGSIAQQWGATNATRHWQMWYDDQGSGTGKIVFITSLGDGLADGQVEAPGINQGTSYDIYVAWDGTTLRLYVDGQFIDSDSAGAMQVSATAVRLGGGVADLTGSFTAFRMTRGRSRYMTETGCQYRPKMPLPSAQATSLDPHYANVVAMLIGGAVDADTVPFDKSPYDVLPSVAGNAQTDSGVTLLGVNSCLFDGTGDAVSIPDASHLEFGSGDFTVDAVVQFTSVATIQTFVSKYDSGGNQRSWRLLYNQGAGTLQFDWSTDGIANNTISGSWSPSTGTPYYLTACRSGSTLRLWIGGVFLTSGALSGTIFNSTSPLRLGAVLSGGSPANVLTGNAIARVTKAARFTSNSNFTPDSTLWPTSG